MYVQKIPLVKTSWNVCKLMMFSTGQENLLIRLSVLCLAGRLLKKMYWNVSCATNSLVSLFHRQPRMHHVTNQLNSYLTFTSYNIFLLIKINKHVHNLKQNLLQLIQNFAYTLPIKFLILFWKLNQYQICNS